MNIVTQFTLRVADSDSIPARHKRIFIDGPPFTVCKHIRHPMAWAAFDFSSTMVKNQAAASNIEANRRAVRGSGLDNVKISGSGQ
jgi:hypothetical protein